MANIIVISGAGSKAFCAGGDVAALAQQNATVEGQHESTDYFALEYKLDHMIATYSKPYVAIMDGITMGGGVGLSVHAPFRIATEKTVFAMPETTIGFFPDVGGGFFLSRLDGEVGTYLALTSERLLGVQAFYAGIATHYLDSSVLPQLANRLSELTFKDYAQLPERLGLINSTISEFTSGLPEPNSYDGSKYGDLSGNIRMEIDRCFQHNTIEEILDALKKESESAEAGAMCDWAAKTLKTIMTRSPTSLKVTLRQLRAGQDWNIRQAFINEHALASNFMAHPDFVEGVTARLMKPTRDPKWNPSELSEVDTATVDSFFTRKEGVDVLELLPPVSSARANDKYTDYPHAGLALPREADVQRAVKKFGDRKAVLDDILQQWNRKEGVKEKVNDVLARKTEKVENKDNAIRWI